MNNKIITNIKLFLKPKYLNAPRTEKLFLSYRMVGDSEPFAEIRSHCEQLLIHIIDIGNNLSFHVSSLGRI